MKIKAGQKNLLRKNEKTLDKPRIFVYNVKAVAGVAELADAHV